MKKTVFFAMIALVLGGTTVTAHKKDNDRRTPADCRTLKNKQLIDNCLICVNRPNPHHFHPLAPKGEKCRPNNGKP